MLRTLSVTFTPFSVVVCTRVRELEEGGCPDVRRSRNEAGGGRLSQAPDGWELVTKDVGLAWLALSVKAGTPREFQTLAPHPSSYEDREVGVVPLVYLKI
jgi:hypothetical protein